MELQGLQEALKVEIQCHQVNETWCYFSLVGVGASENRGSVSGWGAPHSGDSGTPCRLEGSPTTQPPLSSQIKWTFDDTLADGSGSGPSRQNRSGSAVLLLPWADQDATWIFMSEENWVAEARTTALFRSQHTNLGDFGNSPLDSSTVPKLVAQMKQDPQVKAIFAGQPVGAVGSGGQTGMGSVEKLYQHKSRLLLADHHS